MLECIDGYKTWAKQRRTKRRLGGKRKSTQREGCRLIEGSIHVESTDPVETVRICIWSAQRSSDFLCGSLMREAVHSKSIRSSPCCNDYSIKAGHTSKLFHIKAALFHFGSHLITSSPYLDPKQPTFLRTCIRKAQQGTLKRKAL